MPKLYITAHTIAEKGKEVSPGDEIEVGEEAATELYRLGYALPADSTAAKKAKEEAAAKETEAKKAKETKAK